MFTYAPLPWFCVQLDCYCVYNVTAVDCIFFLHRWTVLVFCHWDQLRLPLWKVLIKLWTSMLGLCCNRTTLFMVHYQLSWGVFPVFFPSLFFFPFPSLQSSSPPLPPPLLHLPPLAPAIFPFSFLTPHCTYRIVWSITGILFIFRSVFQLTQLAVPYLVETQGTNPPWLHAEEWMIATQWL